MIFEVKQPMDMLYLSRRGSRTDGQDLFGNLHDFGKLRVLDLSESLLSVSSLYFQVPNVSANV